MFKVSYNFNTRHLAGQQKYVVDKKINDGKKRKATIENKLREIQQKENNVDLAIFGEIKSALSEFIEKNPNDKPEIVFNPNLFDKIKKISPENTYDTGNSTTMFHQNYTVEETEERFSIRRYMQG